MINTENRNASYKFTRSELKTKNGTDFKDGDVISISDSHYGIQVKYGGYEKPSLCSLVYDYNKHRLQDVVFRQSYIQEFLHR